MRRFNTIRSILPAAILSMFAAATFAEDTDKEIPQNDLLSGVIDPFSEGQERSKFLYAAGVDTELVEEEFKKDQTTNEGFVRPFDRWALIALFDANKNNAIDWFEAKDYRHGLQSLLYAKHDSNNDGVLTGNERTAAIRAIHKGQLSKYFNVACCGSANTKSLGTTDRGHEHTRRQLLDTLQLSELPDLHVMSENYQELKAAAINDVRIINGVSESESLPYVSTPDDDAIDRILRPHYENQLIGFMNENGWAELRAVVRGSLGWTLDAAEEGAFAPLDTIHQYFGFARAASPGQSAEPTEIARLSRRMTLKSRMIAGAPVFRAGFAPSPVEVIEKSDFRKSLQGTPIAPRIGAEIAKPNTRIIQIALVARVPEFPLAYTGSPIGSGKPDRYQKRLIRLLYNPDKSYPILHLGEQVAQGDTDDRMASRTAHTTTQ